MDNSALFNQLDYIHIVIFFISTTFGFMKGFIKHFSKTNALFYSCIIAFFLTPHAALIINNSGENVLFYRCASFVISFLIAFIVFMLIISANGKDEKILIPSILSRFIGVLAGILRWLFVSIGVCVFILTFEVKKDEISKIESLKISSFFFKIAKYLMPSYKDTVANHVADSFVIDKPQKDNIIEKPIVEENQQEQEKEDTQQPEREYLIMKHIANFFANVLSGFKKIEEEKEIRHYMPPPKPSEEKKQNIIRAEYGCMSLLEARTKRIAERKKELIEQELLIQMKMKLYND